MNTSKITTPAIVTCLVFLLAAGCKDKSSKDPDASLPDSMVESDTGWPDDAETPCYDGPLTTFSGIAMDDILETGIEGAQVFVDTGCEVLTTQTGEDGAFTVSDVPAEAPVTITVFAENRMAWSFANIMVDQEEQPLYFYNPLNLRDDYFSTVPLRTIKVSGTISNFPAEADGLGFYGPGHGQGSLVTPGEDQDFEIEVPVAGDVETLTYSLAAWSSQTAEVFAVKMITVDTDEDQHVEITMPDKDERIHLTVSANRPILDGELFETMDPAWRHIASIAYTPVSCPFFGGSQLTGFSTEITYSDLGVEVTVPYFSQTGLQNMVRVVLTENFNFAGSSYAYMPIEEGGLSLDVEMLDAPTLHDPDMVFKPGATVSWDPVENIVDYFLVVTVQDTMVWGLFTRETEITFPAFPEDFDQSSLFTSGKWQIRTRWMEMDWHDKGPRGDDEPVKISYSVGGSVEWE